MNVENISKLLRNIFKDIREDAFNVATANLIHKYKKEMSGLRTKRINIENDKISTNLNSVIEYLKTMTTDEFVNPRLEFNHSTAVGCRLVVVYDIAETDEDVVQWIMEHGGRMEMVRVESIYNEIDERKKQIELLKQQIADIEKEIKNLINIADTTDC